MNRQTPSITQYRPTASRIHVVRRSENQMNAPPRPNQKMPPIRRISRRVRTSAATASDDSEIGSPAEPTNRRVRKVESNSQTPWTTKIKPQKGTKKGRNSFKSGTSSDF